MKHFKASKNTKGFRPSKKSFLNGMLLFMLVYFIFHSIYGSRGILAYFKLQSELERSKITLESLRHERLEAENKTKLLRPGSLDKDMLDEKVRSVLGVAKPSENVFSVENYEKTYHDSDPGE